MVIADPVGKDTGVVKDILIIPAVFLVNSPDSLSKEEVVSDVLWVRSKVDVNELVYIVLVDG